MLRQVMGPNYSDTTSETLQFAKFNSTNYHVWSDNSKPRYKLRASGVLYLVAKRALSNPLQTSPI